jgi:hypothetical protein
MTEHLSDQEFCKTISGESGESGQHHLGRCAACRAGRDELLTGIEQYREWIASEVGRPDSFWLGQQRAVAETIGRRSAARPFLIWVLASLACVAVLSLALVMVREPRVPAAAVDPDHELLLDIERALRRDVPEALAPAEILIEEIQLALAARADKTGGERQ